MYSLLTMRWWLYQWTTNDRDIETSEGKFTDSFTITVSPTLYIYTVLLLGVQKYLYVHVGLIVSLIIAIKYYQERMKKREG